MTFTSVLFLFRFLPVFFLLYYLSPAKTKNLVLLLASLFFYAWEEIRFLPWLCSAVLVTYLCALGIAKFSATRWLRNLLCFICISANIGLLFFLKFKESSPLAASMWLGSALQRAILPLGISFYVFRAVGYIIDVFRREVSAEKNIVHFGVYALFFPVVPAGPFIRYKEMSADIKNPKDRLTLSRTEEGIAQFIFGLAKKVLLATPLLSLWQDVMGQYSGGSMVSGGAGIGLASASTGLVWLLLVAFAMWIYFELSGYTSMALGLGMMLGFSLPASFSTPYASRSLTQFCSSWHSTLTGWFKQYLYLPLCGTKKTQGKRTLALFITCFLFGLWLSPGLSFILFAIYMFLILLLERLFLLTNLKSARVWPHIYLLLLLIPAMALLASSAPGAGLLPFLSRLFVPHTGASAWYYLRSYIVPLAAGIVFCTPLPQWIYSRIQKFKWLRIVLLAVLLLLSIVYLFRGETGYDIYRAF